MKEFQSACLRRNKSTLLALVVLLFSAPALGAGKESAPAVKLPPLKVAPLGHAIEPPPPVRPHPPASVIPPPPPGHHAASFSYSSSQPMMVFGFLGLLLFSAGAGVFGKRRPFEVEYRKFPYGSFRSRQNRFS